MISLVVYSKQTLLTQDVERYRRQMDVETTLSAYWGYT